MKCDNIWNLRFFSREHRQGRDKCIAALAMDEIPSTAINNGIDFGCDVVVMLWQPCANSNDTHPLDYFLFGKRSRNSIWCSCQKCDPDTTIDEVVSDFTHMCFYSSYVGGVTWSHHQHAQGACFSCHQFCLFL